nr:MAG TPA: hypothetical protein [Crassvirales sp.]
MGVVNLYKAIRQKLDKKKLLVRGFFQNCLTC